MKLSDCKLIVTGAARGLGAHFAYRLAEAGAQVAAGDVLDDKTLRKEGTPERPDDEASEKDAAVRDLPGRIHRRHLDVTSEESISEFVDWAHQAMGGLTGIINNAGILRDALLVKRDRETGRAVKMSREVWQAVIDVNLTGATFVVRDTVAKMIDTNERVGVVVNISSVARHGNRGQSNYVSAKASLAANTVTWAREFAPLGIRVGAVAPGMVETPMTRGMNQKARDALVQAIPVGRIGEPEDIWLAVKFILECDYFNGRVIDVDGGLHM